MENLIKPLKLSDINFEIIAEFETIEIRGNIMDSGDSEYDTEIEDKTIKAVNNGDVWAWATVEVKGNCRS